MATSLSPADHSDKFKISSLDITSDQRASTVSLTGVLPGTTSTYYAVSDFILTVLGVPALGVGHGHHLNLHHGVGVITGVFEFVGVRCTPPGYDGLQYKSN